MSPTFLPSCSRLGLLCAALGCIAGCASFDTQEPFVSASIELSDTAFYPQTEYWCGPSALATVLQRTNLVVTPERLAEQVYVPGRQGSLQLEMVAATRRHDRLAVRIDPELQAVVQELEAGHPVLVLQNLGIKWLPVWHYAVVVGFDAGADAFVLRSGTTERLFMRRSRFAQSWARADNWAVVVLEPGELPGGRAPAAYVRAVAGLESVGRLDAARRAYKSGLSRWPANDLLLLGYANTLYGSGAIELAVDAYRNLLALDSTNLAALNNLAHALGELGCRTQALALIAQAPDHVDAAFAAALTETRQTIESQSTDSCRLN